MNRHMFSRLGGILLGLFVLSVPCVAMASPLPFVSGASSFAYSASPSYSDDSNLRTAVMLYGNDTATWKLNNDTSDLYIACVPYSELTRLTLYVEYLNSSGTLISEAYETVPYPSSQYTLVDVDAMFNATSPPAGATTVVLSPRNSGVYIHEIYQGSDSHAPVVIPGQVKASVPLVGGILSLTSPSVTTSFPASQLNGQVQTLNASLSSMSVVDATGTFNGWNVTAQASQLTEQAPSSGFTTGTTALTLPSNSLVLNTSGGSITADSGSKPVSVSNGPIFESSGQPIDSSSSVALLEAKQSYGAGTYKVTFPTNALQLTLNPATTEVDTINYPSSPTPYTSTITFTISSAP